MANRRQRPDFGYAQQSAVLLRSRPGFASVRILSQARRRRQGRIRPDIQAARIVPESGRRQGVASAPPIGQEHGRGDLPRARRRIVPNCERFQIAKVIPARADVQESWILRDERRARVRPAVVGTPTGRYAYARRPERTTSLLADSLATDAWGKATA